MTARMAKLDRAIKLVHLLCESAEGLTLDEMADRLEVNRRTVERLRNVIMLHFDLEDVVDGRSKRFRIRDSLRRVYARPTAEEIAALQAECEARSREGGSQAVLLTSLLSKIKGWLDQREKSRLEPDLDALARLQRSRVTAGPAVGSCDAAMSLIQQAIMVGVAVEFDYTPEGASEPKWRRVVPYGLIHGPVTYLIGKMPSRERDPVHYRLDRMSNLKLGNEPHPVPDDWDLDAWLAQSFGIWREDDYEIVLRVLPSAVLRAKAWRFHPSQTFEDDGNELLVRFRAGGLREVAEHLFTWGGDVRIEAPEELRKVMRERVMLAWAST
ncbi:helix-turn-helix transcriptional regulator [Novosphingobium taihuense]|uniref:Putative DNA-binding transcriptional regulator YafY n=1 Tax=Novosphingobium taihuense TaxID=260085 RepID=A0A7W7AEY8_9SPHN|nr:WYL domain-containing transcriptional regulator [Novosphingobium taihuense]MBB4615773.1 putative DNA-binding transcriptional regulator YafY [Novosphingobium taihuense]TWH79689.1 putative DNA-binding transcriptional regulator YafY [Novosphingobium taihuense]